MNNSVTINMVTMLYNQHLYLVSKHLDHSKVPYVLSSYYLFCLSLALETSSLQSVSVALSISHILYKWNHIMCDLWCLASFTCHNVLEVHHVISYISTLFLFYLNNMPSYVYTIICLFIHHWWIFGLLSPFSYCE